MLEKEHPFLFSNLEIFSVYPFIITFYRLITKGLLSSVETLNFDCLS